MKPLLAIVILAAALSAVTAPASARTLTLHDLRSLVNVSEVQISPDATRIAYVRSTADYTHDTWNRTLMLVPETGGTPRAITKTLHSIGSPQWSPAGDRIAYVADDAKKNSQIFVLPSAGGTPTQVTHAKNGVEQFAWSPDGTRLCYVTADSGGKGAWSVHDDGYLTETGPQPAHLWLVSAGGSNERRLTHGSWSVLEAAPPFVGAPTNPSWSPDGRHITFIMQSDADDSDSDRTSVAIADVVNGAVHKLTGRSQYEYQSAYAPQGSSIAYLYPHGPGPISVLNVYVGTRDITPTFDRDVTSFAWLPNNRLLLAAMHGVHNTLSLQSAAGGPAQQLDTGSLDVSEYSAAKTGAIAFIAGSTNMPGEIYVLDSLTAKPRKLTSENAAFAAMQYGRSVEFTWRAPDGERSDGVLTYPVGYVAGKKYPLVLRIHGGPEAATSMGFDSLRQLLAARGYLVLQPNYRGSDNLGSAHEHAIYKDPGTGPGNDVISGVRALEKLGIVNTSREAVTGHSYGGYMTTWMIGHWHHWRSAVVGDGMVDWKEEYDLSAAGNLAWARDSLGGSPWNASSAQLYVTGSPITYATQITTPTRIISGTADETVPASESYELYHALHDRGIPASFIALPAAHHFPSNPILIEAYNRVTLQWVDDYMH